MDIELEWDEAKRQATLSARGLDFADVARLEWEDAITLEDVRQPYRETRFITYGRLQSQMCVMAWCWRGQNIRVISLRRANKREVRKYG